MRHQGFAVDWRSQFASIQPLFTGQGGVVHVHASDSSPVAAFTRVLRSKFVQTHSDGAAVQIAPLNSNTHYLRDIVEQISSSIDLSLDTKSRTNPNVSVTVGKGIRTRGPVTISDLDIAVGEHYGATSDAELVNLLCEGIAHQLRARRIAILFVESHNWASDELRRINDVLWRDALDPLTEVGLLVVDVSDPDVLYSKCDDWLREADVTVSLPDRYDDEARAAAVEDLLSISMDLNIFRDEEEARVFARTLVAASVSVRDLHANLAVAISQFRTGAV